MKPGASPSRSAWWLLGLAVLCGLPAFSRAESRELSLPFRRANPGSLIQVPVLLDNAAGIASVRVKINFSPHLLELQSVSTGPLGSAFELNASTNDGVILLVFTRDSDLISGSGRLAILTFKVNPGAESNDFSELAVAETRFGNDTGVADLAVMDQNSSISGRVTVSTSAFIDNDNDSLPDAWEASHDLSTLDSGTLLDPDGDGWNNLAEYAFGMNPVVSGQNAFASTLGTVQIGNSHYLTLSFRRQIAPPPWLTYAVEESSDLQLWLPLDIELHRLGPALDHGDGTESITVFGTIPISGADSEPRGFLRGRVNSAQP